MLGFLFDEESERNFDNLVGALKNGRVSAFIGTGLSGHAKPDWKQLHSLLLETAGLSARDFDADYAASDISDFRDAMGGPDELLSAIKREFAGPEPDHPELELYRILDGTYGVEHLITTNFDELLYMTARLRQPNPNVLIYPSFPHAARYVYLHGRASSAMQLNQLVLCQEQYDDAYKNAYAPAAFALATYLKGDVVFLGCSLTDPDLAAILKQLGRIGQTEQWEFGPPPFVIQRATAGWTTEQAAIQAKRLLRTLGIRAIWYQHDEDHEAFRKLLLHLRYVAGPDTTEPTFRDTATELDKLGSTELPTVEEQQKVIELIRDVPAYRRHFFRNASSVEWYDVLRDTGILTSVTEPRTDSGGRTRITTWAAGPYVERIATRRPDAVHYLLLQLQNTANWSVHGVLSQAAAELDDNQLRDALPILLRWRNADRGGISLVEHNLTTLLNRLVERGSEHAIELFGGLLDSQQGTS